MYKHVYKFSDQLPEKYYDCEYQFNYTTKFGRLFGYASDSLTNLKQQAKHLGLHVVYITCKTGQFTYGQRFVDEYLYKPRYGRNR